MKILMREFDFTWIAGSVVALILDGCTGVKRLKAKDELYPTKQEKIG